ncbi:MULTISPECIES: hypothetical protein [unclassified Moorena]|nr:MULTISPECIES: hypothetical protein [unclassified Moorena]NEP36995.1 hypothetical protein [Moorena sp. SIO3B2]NEQ16019.1 hypothetical protein [Moorena sp. SIO3E2]NER86814.1 hypothetical protein [Moorena sp. SIO3A2]
MSTTGVRCSLAFGPRYAKVAPTRLAVGHAKSDGSKSPPKAIANLL